MKKFIALFTLAILLVLCVGCGDNSHSHKFGEWKTVSEPDCVSEGLRERVCDCGEKETEAIPALGHTVVIDQGKEATCKDTGLSNGKHCSVCGTVLQAQEELPVADHRYPVTEETLSIMNGGRTAVLTSSCEWCDKKTVGPYTGTYLKDSKAYLFEDGIRKDITSSVFEFGGNTYYVIDNEIQFNIYVVIENHIVFFGDDGVMSNEPIADGEITDYNNNTYYVINSEIQLNVYIKIDNHIYYYGEDGVKGDTPVTGEVSDFEGNTYYIVNNVIQIDVYIKIDNYIYYYGNDGVKGDSPVTGEVKDSEGNTYYIIENVIQINIYIKIDNYIYYYGEDGVKGNAPIEGEVTVGGDVYYVINNEIQVNVYIKIDNYIYYYGESGVKSDAPLTDREVTDINGNIYYVVMNEIKVNLYVRIENHIYYYGSDGVRSEAPLTNCEITIGKNTYYVINNRIQINVYVLIDNHIYYFGSNGVKSSSPVSDGKVTTADGKTYYIVNNTIKLNVYVVIENHIYYFGSDGSMLHDGEHDGYHFGSDGTLTGSDITIEIDGNTYRVNDGVAEETQPAPKTDVTGRVFAANSSNTATTPISGATISVSGRDTNGSPFSAQLTTDSNGAYTLSNIPYGSYTVTVSKDGYISNSASIRIYYANQVLDNIYLVSSEAAKPGSAEGNVINAQTGSYISGITIYVRKGSNVTSGTVLMTLTSDANGHYATGELEAGNYTLQFVDERGNDEKFVSGAISVAIIGGTISNQNVTLSKAVGEGSLRIVLTWGANPSDLDSHILASNGTNNYHVYYQNKSSDSGNITLDVDDTTSYGPETVTVIQPKAGYQYVYYVYNYSGGGDSVLSSSGARITVYMGDEMIYSFSVPTGSGGYWTVFGYSVEDGFTIVNKVMSGVSMG